MTFLDAAIAILQREGRPLHFKKLTEIALQENLLTVVGKTPEATMQQRLNDALKKGDSSLPLIRDKPGVYGLSSYPAKAAPIAAASLASAKTAPAATGPKPGKASSKRDAAPVAAAGQAKATKGDRAARPPKSSSADKPDKPDKPDKTDKPDKPDRSPKSDPPEKAAPAIPETVAITAAADAPTTAAPLSASDKPEKSGRKRRRRGGRGRRRAGAGEGAANPAVDAASGDDDASDDDEDAEDASVAVAVTPSPAEAGAASAPPTTAPARPTSTDRVDLASTGAGTPSIHGGGAPHAAPNPSPARPPAALTPPAPRRAAEAPVPSVAPVRMRFLEAATAVAAAQGRPLPDSYLNATTQPFDDSVRDEPAREGRHRRRRDERPRRGGQDDAGERSRTGTPPGLPSDPSLEPAAAPTSDSTMTASTTSTTSSASDAPGRDDRVVSSRSTEETRASESVAATGAPPASDGPDESVGEAELLDEFGDDEFNQPSGPLIATAYGTEDVVRGEDHREFVAGAPRDPGRQSRQREQREERGRRRRGKDDRGRPARPGHEERPRGEGGGGAAPPREARPDGRPDDRRGPPPRAHAAPVAPPVAPAAAPIAPASPRAALPVSPVYPVSVEGQVGLSGSGDAGGMIGAAIEILRAGDGRPVHARQIAEMATRRKLIPAGDHGELARVLRTAIVLDARIREAGGLRPRFRRTGADSFQLVERKLDADLARAEAVVQEAATALSRVTRDALQRRLSQLPLGSFEILMRALLPRIGVDGAELVKRGDGVAYFGAERVRGTERRRVLIGLRSGAAELGRLAVGELRAGLKARGFDEGLLVSPGPVAGDALDELSAGSGAIEILDGAALGLLCARDGVGIVRRQLVIETLDLELLGDLGEATGG